MASSHESAAPRPALQTDSILNQLESLSDDEFFQRLSALRAEHKKTLAHYESLYHEKLMAETGDIGKVFGEPLFSFAESVRQSADGSERPCVSSGTVAAGSLTVTGRGVQLTDRSPATEASQPEPDAVTEETAPTVEPMNPTVEGLGRDYTLSLHEPVNTQSDTFNQNLEVLRRSADKPPRSPCPAEKPPPSPTPAEKPRPPCPVHKCREAWTAPAAEDEACAETRRLSDSSGGEVDYDESRYQRERDAALERIETMWEDFNVNEYKEARPRSTDWRHRITMPQPFRMTLREESKEKRKSRTLSEYEHQKAMERMSERFECEKKFRAAPVPAHVYLPLYDEMMEQAETRRRQNVQSARDLLKSQERPFKFAERQKKIPDHSRRHSEPKLKHKQFRAKPIPRSVRDDVTERILEEEEYRKIRIKMRSKELLRSSSLPPRMASREEYSVGKLKEKLQEEKKKSFQPKIKKRVPDFDAIHRKQRNEAANQYKARDRPVATVCEPFRLRSNSIPSNMDKVIKDIQDDEKNLVENRWPYKNPRAKPKLGEVRRSYDALPPQYNTSEALRLHKKCEELKKKKSVKEEQEEKNRRRKEEMARKVAERARQNDHSATLRATAAESLRQKREEDRVRMMEYKKQLAEIEKKVRQEPFLFERQSQKNARLSVDKKLADTLKRAGLDDVSIQETLKGPRSPSDVHDSVDFNATYDADHFQATYDDEDDFTATYTDDFHDENADEDAEKEELTS